MKIKRILILLIILIALAFPTFVNADSEEVFEKNIDYEDIKKSIETNLILSNISSKESEELLRELDIKNHTKGIMLENSSKELLLDFINGHTCYTYALDDNNMLIQEKKLRENEKLDYLEPYETEMDYVISQIIDEEFTIIEIGDKYYELDDNNLLKQKRFIQNEYLKSSFGDECNYICLNSNYYNIKNNIDFNLDLSDTFVKALNRLRNNDTIIVNEDIVNLMSISSLNYIGIMNSHQTVWSGPNSNGTYATVGSVDGGETVSIIEKESGYYHIIYTITSGSNINKKKTGYVDEDTVISLLTPLEMQTNGGYRYSNSNVSIKSYEKISESISYGSVSQYEGVTLLYYYTYIEDDNTSYQMAFVEYSTSSGMKRGYVRNSYLTSPFSSVLIKSPTLVTTYTGPDKNKFNIDTGAIGSGEYVCAIGYVELSNYIFIEYNTNAGRRRAFIESPYVSISDPSILNITALSCINYNTSIVSTELQEVSAAPGAAYSIAAYRGMVGYREPVYQALISNNVYNQLNYVYVVYHVGNSLKGGYIQSSKTETLTNPAFPDLPVYTSGNFSRTYIGTTGLNQPLYAYSLGTGNNKIYLCFNQHGWEDGGIGDGVELVKIAIDMMDIINSNKNNTGNGSTGPTTLIANIDMASLLEDWTIYVIPSINRDGITSGWGHHDPGRRDVVTKIDINRNWDTSYYVEDLDESSKCYTGTVKEATVSCQTLKSYLLDDDIKPVEGYYSILLDVHGWDGEVIAWDSDSTDYGDDYFVPQFYNANMIGFSNSNLFRSRQKATTGAGGYLMRWAVETLGTTNSMLVELPLKTNKTIDRDFIVENQYSLKLTTAVLNMMEDIY